MKVEIYTTENCYHCKQAKDYFRKEEIDFVEHNVTNNVEEARKIFTLSGQMGVPTILIDGHVVVGFDKKKIKELLDGGK